MNSLDSVFVGVDSATRDAVLIRFIADSMFDYNLPEKAFDVMSGEVRRVMRELRQ